MVEGAEMKGMGEFTDGLLNLIHWDIPRKGLRTYARRASDGEPSAYLQTDR